MVYPFGCSVVAHVVALAANSEASADTVSGPFHITPLLGN